VLRTPCGDVTSVRGRTDAGQTLSTWTLRTPVPAQPNADRRAIWPRPDERDRVTRRALAVTDPADGRALYVTRDEALPAGWAVDDRIVWAAGTSTWRKLAARGVWVHGSSEGLGVFDPSAVDRLAGRVVAWHRLTHAGAGMPDALATYETDSTLPDDLAARTHFFWRSGQECRRALAAHPALRERWHAAGPGHTFDVARELVEAGRVRPFLGYEQWLEEVTA